MNKDVDLSAYNFSFSLRNKLARVVWSICYFIFFRPFNLNIFRTYRNFILRVFGAKISSSAHIYATSIIWAPWNLEIGDYSTIGPKVDVYNQGRIIIGNNTVISQKSYLCASTHDFQISNFPLMLAPICIENQVWIAADAFIGPGVIVGEGAVVGARGAVFRNVEPWTVVGGNPAQFLKERKIRHA